MMNELVAKVAKLHETANLLPRRLGTIQFGTASNFLVETKFLLANTKKPKYLIS
jgi:hypothetical protein